MREVRREAMADDLKVPKQRAEVEVLFPGGGVRQVVVFLAEFAEEHSGAERLSDLLNGPGEFLPAIDLQNDAVIFLGRQSIAAARVRPRWEPANPVAGAEHEVEITLADGATLWGRINFVLPPERRLLDYLNLAEPFLRLQEKDKVSLINKRHIARVAKVNP
ncbi:MAG: hypothetical protein E6J78_10650 [Deltaproteobacteria bacterium]|nr:MAG: hypothetical protein E6J78_10650 [Deltaproteobacteria bacterium]